MEYSVMSRYNYIRTTTQQRDILNNIVLWLQLKHSKNTPKKNKLSNQDMK